MGLSNSLIKVRRTVDVDLAVLGPDQPFLDQSFLAAAAIPHSSRNRSVFMVLATRIMLIPGYIGTDTRS
jgi:hypothetical protein